MTILRIPIPGQPGLYREVDEATGEPVSFEVFDSHGIDDALVYLGSGCVWATLLRQEARPGLSPRVATFRLSDGRTFVAGFWPETRRYVAETEPR